MSAVRTAFKALTECLLGAPSVVAVALRRLRGAQLVLSYHNVVAGDAPPATGDRSLHLPLTRFRAQLDALAAAGLRVLPLGEQVKPGDAPSVAISFDDAYAGTLEYALPELSARGLPSTIFVAPGLLGSSAPWWDRLASPADGAVPEALRQRALTELAGQESRILEAAEAQGWALTPAAPEHRIACEDELDRALQAHPGLTLGAHTWSHPNVAQLAAAELRREVVRAREWLQGRYPERYVNWLAYPYGMHNTAAESAAAAAGYAGALLVTGGWDRQISAPHARPRLNVTPGLSDAGFRLRLAGFA